MATIIITVDTGLMPAHDIRVGLVNIINEALGLHEMNDTGGMPVLSDVRYYDIGEPDQWDITHVDGGVRIITGP